jgi:DnaD/phage-associated family protein
MQYIMKTALSLADSGIGTYEQLEEYLKKKEEANTEVSKFKTHCGFGNRALTSKEEKFFVRWFEEMRYSFEVVRLAYEITVDKTHELSFNYMGKILENWFAAGYKTPEDIKNVGGRKPVSKGTADSFNVDDFVAAALKKSGY